jgi:hypothetical protein
VLAQTQQTCVQRLSPKNKGVSLYIPLQAGYRSKKQSSTHIWLHVTLLAISFPQCYVTFFMFQLFKFYLSAMPSLSTASLSEDILSVSLLVPCFSLLHSRQFFFTRLYLLCYYITCKISYWLLSKWKDLGIPDPCRLYLMVL